jgi:hypothetical protein
VGRLVRTLLGGWLVGIGERIRGGNPGVPAEDAWPMAVEVSERGQQMLERRPVVALVPEETERPLEGSLEARGLARRA